MRYIKALLYLFLTFIWLLLSGWSFYRVGPALDAGRFRCYAYNQIEHCPKGIFQWLDFAVISYLLAGLALLVGTVFFYGSFSHHINQKTGNSRLEQGVKNIITRLNVWKQISKERIRSEFLVSIVATVIIVSFEIGVGLFASKGNLFGDIANRPVNLLFALVYLRLAYSLAQKSVKSITFNKRIVLALLAGFLFTLISITYSDGYAGGWSPTSGIIGKFGFILLNLLIFVVSPNALAYRLGVGFGLGIGSQFLLWALYRQHRE